MNHFKKMLVCMFSGTLIVSAHNSLYFFAHGIADSGAQAYHYTRTHSVDGKNVDNDRWIIDDNVITFNFPDAHGWLATIFRINFRQTDLAQETEIAALSDAYNKAITENPFHDFILIGMSRGASTIINFLALKNPPKVRALILESPFDSIPAIIKDLYAEPWQRKVARNFVSTAFPLHNLKGLQPIDVVGKLPIALPMLIICSEQDTRVPCASSLRLAQKLVKTGHTQIFVVQLPRGYHSKLLSGPDGHIYQKAVHAFYTLFNLPHDTALALEGAEYLNKYTV
jgi:pimeloyl-ACP methyl ester carboxylesterase